MRFAFILRHRRRLLMQFDPSQGSLASSNNLKRTFAQQATARKVPKIEGAQTPTSSSRGTTSIFSPEFVMPNPPPPPSSSSHVGSRSKGSSFGRSSRAPPPSFKGGRGKGKSSVSLALSRLPLLEGPVHAEQDIEAQFADNYPGAPLPKPVLVSNPKGSLSNWMSNAYNKLPTYESKEGRLEDGRIVWRCDDYLLNLYLNLTIGQNYD